MSNWHNITKLNISNYTYINYKWEQIKIYFIVFKKSRKFEVTPTKLYQNFVLNSLHQIV